MWIEPGQMKKSKQIFLNQNLVTNTLFQKKDDEVEQEIEDEEKKEEDELIEKKEIKADGEGEEVET